MYVILEDDTNIDRDGPFTWPQVYLTMRGAKREMLAAYKGDYDPEEVSSFATGYEFTGMGIILSASRIEVTPFARWYRAWKYRKPGFHLEKIA